MLEVSALQASDRLVRHDHRGPREVRRGARRGVKARLGPDVRPDRAEVGVVRRQQDMPRGGATRWGMLEGARQRVPTPASPAEPDFNFHRYLQPRRSLLLTPTFPDHRPRIPTSLFPLTPTSPLTYNRYFPLSSHPISTLDPYSSLTTLSPLHPPHPLSPLLPSHSYFKPPPQPLFPLSSLLPSHPYSPPTLSFPPTPTHCFRMMYSVLHCSTDHRFSSPFALVQICRQFAGLKVTQFSGEWLRLCFTSCVPVT